MRFSDETLMAFADGELDEPTRSAVEQAMRVDPTVAAKVAQHKALRADIFGAFAPTLSEPVPPRLKQVTSTGNVIHLDTVRASKKEVVEQQRRSWAWPEWGAMAATLVVGVLAGSLGFKSIQGDVQLASAQDGTLTAQGPLADALSQQLASARPANPNVKIGLSFVSKEGNYCRSFMLGSSGGLACRSGKQWEIPVLAQSEAGTAGAYRQAGSAMPPAVLDAIDQRISGQALDAKAEQAAAQQGWKR